MAHSRPGNQGAPDVSCFAGALLTRSGEISWTGTTAAFDITLGATQIKTAGKCLDAGVNPADGTRPTLKDCDGNEMQNFWFTNDGRLALMDKGLCLDAHDDKYEVGKPVVLNYCGDGIATQGFIRGAEPGPGGKGAQSAHENPAATSGGEHLLLQSQAHNDLCMDFDDQTAILKKCSASMTNLWTINHGATRVSSGSKCMTAYDGGNKAQDGTQLTAAECQENDGNQNFWWTDDGRLALKDSGLCVDVKDGNFAEGAKLQLWTCTGGSINQAWQTASPATTAEHAGPEHAEKPEEHCPQSVHPQTALGRCMVMSDDGPVLGDCNTGKGNRGGFVLNKGETQIRSTFKSDVCLDAGDNPGDNSVLTSKTCDPRGRGRQTFWVTEDGRIALKDKGLCLDIQDGNFHDGKIQLYTCVTGSPNQAWAIFNRDPKCQNDFGFNAGGHTGSVKPAGQRRRWNDVPMPKGKRVSA